MALWMKQLPCKHEPEFESPDSQFRSIGSMTVMAGSMAAGSRQSAGAAVVAGYSQEPGRDGAHWEWSGSFKP